MKIAITGRADIGKSTIIRIMDCEFPKKVVSSGDTLEGLNKSVFPHVKTKFSQRCQQRALYHLQREMDNILEDTHPEKLVLCDHGSLDLLALWPDTAETFFQELKTSLDSELKRYDWVLQINGVEKKYSANRFQPIHDPRNFWRKHPRFLEIPVQKGFSFSYMQTALVIKNILSGRSYVEIKELLENSIQDKDRSGFLFERKEIDL